VPHCQQCGRAGVIKQHHDDAPDSFAWCDCGHVKFVRQDRGDGYPESLAATALANWPRERDLRKWHNQSDRWNEHRRQRVAASGITGAYRKLEDEFACSDNTDRREDILKLLESGEFDHKPAAPPVPPSPTPMHPITQADIDAAKAKRRRESAA